MDFASVIRRRLEELGLGQRDLAGSCEVTESYISQLLSGKKSPPLPNRTDIYDKMSRFLGLPREELARSRWPRPNSSRRRRMTKAKSSILNCSDYT